MKPMIDILAFVVVALMMTSWIWINWLEKPVKFLSDLFVYPKPKDLRFKEEMIKKLIERNLEERREIKMSRREALNTFSDHFSLSCPTGVPHKTWSPEQKQSLRETLQEIVNLEEVDRNKNI